jgi:hypothetical protein
VRLSRACSSRKAGACAPSRCTASSRVERVAGALSVSSTVARAHVTRRFGKPPAARASLCARDAAAFASLTADADGGRSARGGPRPPPPPLPPPMGGASQSSGSRCPRCPPLIGGPSSRGGGGPQMRGRSFANGGPSSKRLPPKPPAGPPPRTGAGPPRLPPPLYPAGSISPGSSSPGSSSGPRRLRFGGACAGGPSQLPGRLPPLLLLLMA